MEPITAESPEAQSADPVAENIAKLKELFPELVTEAAQGASVNVDVLKQLVGDHTVTDVEEKYGLSWHGKRAARKLALTPSLGTLRPCPDESEDWEKTQNLFIEGDNLEALKLLQKSYAGKVKLIYIDPPYNTGRDFVYPDNFKDNIRNYKELTGQADREGRAISSNNESSGRFHTDWLNMMYPRLKAARNLLKDDGLILISIDDNEVQNAKRMLDEIFGEENSIGILPTIMNMKGNNDQFGFSGTHEFTVAYIKDISSTEDLGGIDLTDKDEDEYAESDTSGRFKKGATLMRTGEAGSRQKRPKGYYPIYVSKDMDRMSIEKLKDDDIKVYPKTKDGREMSWRRSPEKLKDTINDFTLVSS